MISLNLCMTGRFDLQIAQALNETTPDWIIFSGDNGSIIPLYCAYLLDQGGKSAALIKVVKNQTEMLFKENIYFIEDDPLHGPDVMGQINKLILPWHQIVVVLEHCPQSGSRLAQIQRFAPLVTEGSCLLLDEELQTFAEKQVLFEPNWVRTAVGTYRRTKCSRSFNEVPTS